MLGRRKAESRAEMLASWEGLERALPQWVGCRKLVWMSIRRRQVVESRAIGAGIFGEVSVDGVDRGNGNSGRVLWICDAECVYD